jgi:hypothetical protein
MDESTNQHGDHQHQTQRIFESIHGASISLDREYGPRYKFDDAKTRHLLEGAAPQFGTVGRASFNACRVSIRQSACIRRYASIAQVHELKLENTSVLPDISAKSYAYLCLEGSS